VRAARFVTERAWTLVFRDGDRGRPDSGHVALFVTLADRSAHAARLVVANTHVRWDAPGTPADAQVGLREVRALLDERARVPSALPCVVCGDFNATADSDIVRAMRDAGFVDAYRARANDATCNSNARAKRIDYVFHTRELGSEPWPVAPLADDAVLPSPAEPSDHLPIGATITRVAST
jgi:endonuclease/exonuclease/phosphatase family metal-dependent hydrolase